MSDPGPPQRMPIHRKVTVGAGMATFVTIVVWAIDEIWGVKIPAEVAVAGSGFLTFVAQYFTKNQEFEE
jgi:hypothetical protein